ncbi:MAG TPA: AMP-binding protein [Acidimicrobiales bacterium]
MNENFATVWEALADAVGERIAVVHGPIERSWREFDERASRLAGALSALGVGRGSFVAIDMWNCVENLETMFAAFKLRAVPFNVNFRYRETELSYIFKDAKPDAIVFDPILSDRITAAKDYVGLPMRQISIGPRAIAPGVLSMEELIDAHQPMPRIERDGDDEVVIYTGGTTGYPKGVVWPHFACMNQNSLSERTPPLADHVAAVVAAVQPRALVFPPLMHGTGFFGATLTLTDGGCVVFCESRSLNPPEILRLIEQYQIASFSVVGDAVAKPILDELDSAAAAGHPYDLSSVQFVNNTGVMWSASVKKAFLKHGNFQVRDSINSTEGAGFAMAEAGDGEAIETARFKLGQFARVVDENLQDVIPGSGQVGFLVAGGILPKGYLNDPEKTARTWPIIDGKRYVMPGDMATVEEDGTVVLLGRGSEVINTGGEKVFVEEVEQAILSHPATSDALVIGLPDERWGTRVTAVVSLRQGATLTEREVIDHVGGQLADYKRPRQVVFVDEVPRSPTGKADRPAAKKLATDSIS